MVANYLYVQFENIGSADNFQRRFSHTYTRWNSKNGIAWVEVEYIHKELCIERLRQICARDYIFGFIAIHDNLDFTKGE